MVQIARKIYGEIMKPCLVLSLAFSLIGCAGPRPMIQEDYDQFSNLVGYMQKCMENNQLSPQLFGEASTAISQALGTWSYEQGKLTSMMHSAYANADPSASNCTTTQATAYRLLAEARQYRGQIQANQNAWNDAIKSINRNKPIYCNKVGNTIMCS